MTDTSACGRIEFHILWCRDCISLIRWRFRDQVSTFGFGLRRSSPSTILQQNFRLIDRVSNQNCFLGHDHARLTRLVLRGEFVHFCVQEFKLHACSFCFWDFSCEFEFMISVSHHENNIYSTQPSIIYSKSHFIPFFHPVSCQEKKACSSHTPLTMCYTLCHLNYC